MGWTYFFLFLTTTEETIMEFIPTTNNSLLIRDHYKGLDLPAGLAYRDNNIEKANSVLAIGLEQKHCVYLFEIYSDTNFKDFGTDLSKKDATAKYLQAAVNSHIKLVIFTHIDLADVIALVAKLNPDFAFIQKIDDIQTDAVKAAYITYSVAEHVLEPKKTKKSKQMTGSILTDEEKQMSLTFELMPRLGKPS